MTSTHTSSDIHIRAGLAKGDPLAPVRKGILSIDDNSIVVGERGTPAQVEGKPLSRPANSGIQLSVDTASNPPEIAFLDEEARILDD